MICDRCGRDNPEPQKFCQDCGRVLSVPAPAIVPPTPPVGMPLVPVPVVAPAGDRPSAFTSRPEAPPLAFSSRRRSDEPAICARCRTFNPTGGRFCVACGSALDEQGPRDGSLARTAPSPAPPRPPVVVTAPRPTRDATAPETPPPVVPPTPVVAAAPVPIVAAPAAAGAPGPIVAAPVVAIAPAPEPVAATVTCPRCNGSSDASLPFCKFCGARLGTPSRPPPAPRPPPPRAPGLPPVPSPPPPAPAASSSPAPPTARVVARAPAAVAPPGPLGGQDLPPVVLDPTAFPPGPAAAPAPSDVPALSRTGAHGTPSGAAHARLVVIGKDGRDGPSFPLLGDVVDLGRAEGSVVVADDPYISPRHLRFARREGKLFVRDLGSLNGVFLRLRGPHALVDSDLLLVGLEVIRFEIVKQSERGLGQASQHGTLLFGSPATPVHARLCQRTVEGITRNVYHLHRDETTIGREAADIVFADDPYMSRRHAAVRRDPPTGSFALVDLGSSNGTFVAIREETEIVHGDWLRVGQHVFRLDLGSATNIPAGPWPGPDAPADGPAPPTT